MKLDGPGRARNVLFPLEGARGGEVTEHLSYSNQ